MSRGRRSWLVGALMAGLLAVATAAHATTPPPVAAGSHPWIVALCKFTDLSTEPAAYTPAYFGSLFAGTGSSSLDMADWWKEISYSKIDIAGTKVTTQWYSLGMTRFEFAGLTRFNKIKACGDVAANDANIGNDYSQFEGIIAVFNDDTLAGAGTPVRSATTTTTGALTAGATTVNVASAAGFPAAPFPVNIDDGSGTPGSNNEEVHVTSTGSGTNWTIQRGYQGSTAKTHTSGAAVALLDGGDLGASDLGKGPMTLNGKNYNLGQVILPPETNLGAAQHEVGHGFGYDHSRALSTSTTDYQDCYDTMSFDACRNYTSSLYNFQGDFGAAGILNDPLPAAVSPGLDAIDLDLQGWMPAGRTFTYSPGSCAQTTRDVAALGYPSASGDMEIRVPGTVTIPLPNPPGGTTNSDYYTIELRDKSLWDRGIPQNSVLLHLHGLDGRSYWVDTFNASAVGTAGAMYLADQFVDSANNVIITVNRMNTAAHTATVAISTGGANCKLDSKFTYNGATTGDFSDAVTLAGDLTVNGTSVPIPSANVTLSLGTQSCSATTDAAGHASCSVTITQHPGTVTAGGAYAGDTAYDPSSDSTSFEITKEDTQVTYGGALTKDYHDVFTASATLIDPDDSSGITGKTVTFTLGAGDSCSDTTDGSGVASCSITPTQPAGTVTMVTSFGGDIDYLPSGESDAFAITKEESTTTYTGPTVILAGSSGATLTATLVEDGANDDDGDGGSPAPVPSGQTITFAIGSQSCSDTTDAAGLASCTIPSISSAALGSNTLTTTFAGDAYYLPSSDSDAVIVFAFPSRGAFVLGNTSVAAATPSTTLTWWDNSWAQRNVLSGGSAPASFKGFAGSVTTLPTQSPANVCGTRFTTSPGNSPPPTADVPSYMGVLVAGSVTKSGSAIDGTWGKIVVVRTGPGYAPNPGHPGTGTTVATFCP
jgi:hypothetical protein